MRCKTPLKVGPNLQKQQAKWLLSHKWLTKVLNLSAPPAHLCTYPRSEETKMAKISHFQQIFGFLHPHAFSPSMPHPHKKISGAAMCIHSIKHPYSTICPPSNVQHETAKGCMNKNLFKKKKKKKKLGNQEIWHFGPLLVTLLKMWHSSHYIDIVAFFGQNFQK